ncbi:MAG TPA: hypothetical protein VI997_08730 [Candidatus Thermoplasmatota archaeon]|nr:hypothetical protein [Candidatus Thermoplasmatota archaeon]
MRGRLGLVEFLRAVLGAALLLAPGVALVWALLPDLDRVKAAALAVVLAFTVVPAIVLVLNVALRVPITALTFVLVALLVTGGAVAWRLGVPRWRARRAGS